MYVVSGRQRPDPLPSTVERGRMRGPGALHGIDAGAVLLASVLVGLGLGHLIDQTWACAPWGMVGGAAVFILVGLYHVVREHHA